MRPPLNHGASNLAGILIIIFIIIILTTNASNNKGDTGLGWAIGNNISNGNYSISGSSSNNRTNSNDNSSNTNSGTNEVVIGTGNAAYSYQPYEEYITLDNRSRTPINITGWQLRNGKDKRPYYIGSNLQKFSADIAIIPQATLILSPNDKSINQDVILGDNERAIITTGSIGNRSPYTITSFKENICTGYLEDLPNYAFNPALSRNCPRPNNELGIENMDTSCRNIVSSISSCETPQIGEKINNEYCADCYKGKLLSSNCKTFIQEHFNYQGCLIYHQSDPKFSGQTWRVFLGRGWEMWAKEYESIELFDRFGQLVNYQNY